MKVPVSSVFDRTTNLSTESNSIAPISAELISVEPIAAEPIAVPIMLPSDDDRISLPPVFPPELPPEEVEPNDSIDTAIDTGIGNGETAFFFTTAFSGNNPNFAANLDVDFYKVELRANEQLVVNIDTNTGYPVPLPLPEPRPMPRPVPLPTAQPTQLSIAPPIVPPYFPTVDLNLRLFDATGKELAIVYDAPAPWESYSSDPYLEYIIDTPGTYYVGVSSFGNVQYNPFQPGSGNNYGDTTGSYSISFSKIVPPQITGTADDDVLEGTSAYDLIAGLAGDDTIQALGGVDRITGGTGADLILAGEGDDRVEGNEDGDRIFGEAGNDTLYGNSGRDWLSGSEGTDTLFGGEGQDDLQGGEGDDKLSGDAGNDTLRGGTGTDLLEGGDGNDTLIGVSTNSLFGAYGLYENDTLTGGKGKDLFVLGDRDRVYYDDMEPLFDNAYNAATITDFNVNEDQIQLKGSAELYSLDFYRSSTGRLSAALIYDAGIESRGETIALLENVSISLKLTSPAFKFV